MHFLLYYMYRFTFFDTITSIKTSEVSWASEVSLRTDLLDVNDNLTGRSIFGLIVKR